LTSTPRPVCSIFAALNLHRAPVKQPYPVSMRVFLRPEADGQERHVFRCPRRLAALWSERLDSKEMITVYAGTLDDSAKLKPVAHIWTSDAQPWITLPEQSLQFRENPPNMEPIMRAWRLRKLKKEPNRQSATPRPGPLRVSSRQLGVADQKTCGKEMKPSHRHLPRRRTKRRTCG
jgi:hypothetical protein